MVPGQYGFQLVLPEQRKAVFVFSNDDTYGPAVTKVVAYGLMDAILGIDVRKGDWESRVLRRVVPDSGRGDVGRSDESDGGHGRVQSEVKDASQVDRMSLIIGTYRHPSYPNMTISRLPPDSSLWASFPTIQSLASVPLDLPTSNGSHIFVAHPESVFVDTILFVPTGPGLYTWIATKLYDEMGSDGKTTGKRVVPFVDGCGTCIVTERDAGCSSGMSGDWWVSGGKRSRVVQEDYSDEQVEVWFVDSSRLAQARHT
jgi:hypothetical protein